MPPRLAPARPVARTCGAGGLRLGKCDVGRHVAPVEIPLVARLEEFASAFGGVRRTLGGARVVATRGGVPRGSPPGMLPLARAVSCEGASPSRSDSLIGRELSSVSGPGFQGLPLAEARRARARTFCAMIHWSWSLTSMRFDATGPKGERPGRHLVRVLDDLQTAAAPARTPPREPSRQRLARRSRPSALPATGSPSPTPSTPLPEGRARGPAARPPRSGDHPPGSAGRPRRRASLRS